MLTIVVALNKSRKVRYDNMNTESATPLESNEFNIIIKTNELLRQLEQVDFYNQPSFTAQKL